jgi:hypothetical protein
MLVQNHVRLCTLIYMLPLHQGQAPCMRSPEGFHLRTVGTCNYTQCGHGTFPGVHEKRNSQPRKGICNKYININLPRTNNLSRVVLRKYRVKNSSQQCSRILHLLHTTCTPVSSVTDAMQYGYEL